MVDFPPKYEEKRDEKETPSPFPSFQYLKMKNLGENKNTGRRRMLQHFVLRSETMNVNKGFVLMDGSFSFSCLYAII